MRNSARISTVANGDGSETRYISRGILEIVGEPALDRIVLEYPDAFAFGYTGETPMELEIILSEDFSVGDTVCGGDPAAVSLLRVKNPGYGLKAEDGAALLVLTDPCLVTGHDWAEATCTEPKTCTVCRETEGEAAGHAYSAGLCAACSDDTVITDLDGGSFTLSGPLEEGTRIFAADYDAFERFSSAKELAWHGDALEEELPAWDAIRIFFLDADWIPLRKAIPLK